jgi:hypothetical protein
MTSIAWSYSSLTAFETCPRRYGLTKVTKEVVEPQTEVLLHGNRVHKALEERITGTPLPPMYAQYEPIAGMVASTEGMKKAEVKFALTHQLTPTSFFASDVWVRGVFDVVIDKKDETTVLDWKTGKPKTDSDQLKLFAAAAFSLRPSIQKVRTGFVWLAYNKVDREDFVRDQVPDLWDEFRPRVARLTIAHSTNQFPPHPSGLCSKWCPVPKSKCEFSGKA